MRVQCQILAEDERQKVHDESIKILEEIGVKFLSDRALKVMNDNGAKIDKSSKIARIPAEMVEQVYDAACSDGGTVDPETHRCPDNGARVDVSTCAYPQDVGAAELAAVWEDPDFNPDQRAFYYVRALENPTCRWSTWDAIRNNTRPRPDLPMTIQERVWSSPIWYVPGE